MFRNFVLAATAALLAITGQAHAANDFEPQIKAFVESDIMPWLSEAVVVDAVKAQNEKHASITDADIEAMDQEWRAEAKAGSGTMVDAALASELSKFLRSKKEASGGKISEIFVMDNKGLNVGQSDITSDYMQGDEAKWQKSYGAGPGAMFVDDIEFDDSSQAFQSQVSVTIVDGSGAAIGAITIGINVEEL